MDRSSRSKTHFPREKMSIVSLAVVFFLIQLNGSPWCIQHQGDPNIQHTTTMSAAATSIPALNSKNKINFWRKIDRNGPLVDGQTEQCWLWLGSKNAKGYGLFGVGGKIYSAHRIAFSVASGVFSEEKSHCLHRCDNPSCVNPAHLFAGSNQDNQDDMIAKGRAKKAIGDANGARRHPEKLARGDANGARLHPERLAHGEKNKSAKLSDAQCNYIRSSFLPATELALELGVSAHQIRNIRCGRSRKLAPSETKV